MTTKEKLDDLEKRVINLEMKLQYALRKQKAISIKRGKKKKDDKNGTLPFKN
jgi:hypothetical protein